MDDECPAVGFAVGLAEGVHAVLGQSVLDGVEEPLVVLLVEEVVGKQRSRTGTAALTVFAVAALAVGGPEALGALDLAGLCGHDGDGEEKEENGSDGGVGKMHGRALRRGWERCYAAREDGAADSPVGRGWYCSGLLVWGRAVKKRGTR